MEQASLALADGGSAVQEKLGSALLSRGSNRLAVQDRAIHGWYRFVLAFPPHLVRTYLDEFGIRPGQTVLDPFCGTGTTLVEGKKLGCDVMGFEANPVAHLAATVKTRWDIQPEHLLCMAKACAADAETQLAAGAGPTALPPEAMALLLANSICPRPLRKAMILNDAVDRIMTGALRDAGRVALATTLVQSASNLHFGPEVGVRGRRGDADVIGSWLAQVEVMASDLRTVADAPAVGSATVLHRDAREVGSEIPPRSIDAVFTSPPYPNEKDYTRTTRLESVILGFISNKQELQALKRQLIRSNTRGVYKGDADEQWVAGNERIEAICHEIEARRVSLGKTSGFERMYHRVVRLYFGGMARQLASLRPVLKQGAMLGYVVGDQASYLQVMIRTGEILAELAEGLGYEVCRLDLFRERFATATRMQVREEVLVLRWPGTTPA